MFCINYYINVFDSLIGGLRGSILVIVCVSGHDLFIKAHDLIKSHAWVGRPNLLYFIIYIINSAYFAELAIIIIALALLLILEHIRVVICISVKVDPISDALCEDGECVCADEQGATLSHGAHASKLLILFDNLAKDLIIVVSPAYDLAVVAT